MIRRLLSLTLIALPFLLQAQTQINPITQVDWTKLTGSGVPTLTCTAEQYGEQYTDIALPEADQAAMRTMIGRPGGISTRAAASSLPWSHTHVHRQLMRWRLEGTAEVRGKGSARRWYAAAPGAAPVSWPPLRALPDPPEPRAEGDLP